MRRRGPVTHINGSALTVSTELTYSSSPRSSLPLSSLGILSFPHRSARLASPPRRSRRRLSLARASRRGQPRSSPRSSHMYAVVFSRGSRARTDLRSRSEPSSPPPPPPPLYCTNVLFPLSFSNLFFFAPLNRRLDRLALVRSPARCRSSPSADYGRRSAESAVMKAPSLSEGAVHAYRSSTIFRPVDRSRSSIGRRDDRDNRRYADSAGERASAGTRAVGGPPRRTQNRK